MAKTAQLLILNGALAGYSGCSVQTATWISRSPLVPKQGDYVLTFRYNRKVKRWRLERAANVNPSHVEWDGKRLHIVSPKSGETICKFVPVR